MSITTLTEIASFKDTGRGRIADRGQRPWKIAVAAGDVPGAQIIEKFGNNPAAASGEAITDEGAAIAIETTETTIEIKLGGNVNDTAAGSGAKKIEVFGVDLAFNPVTAEIVTNGASVSAATTEVFMYVYRARVIDSGAQVNAGNIVITRSSAGATLAQITAAKGQTQKCIMPVFAGCKLFVDMFRFDGSKTGAITGEMSLVEYELTQGIRIRHSIVFSSAVQKAEHFTAPKVFEPKSLVWVESFNLSTGAVISASFDGYFIRYTDSTP